MQRKPIKRTLYCELRRRLQGRAALESGRCHRPSSGMFLNGKMKTQIRKFNGTTLFRK
jgi:hypothetical protein